MRVIAGLVVVVAMAVAAAFLLTQSDPPRISVSGASLVPAPDGTMALFVTIDNQGAPDILNSVSSPEAPFAHFMNAAGSLAIPAGSSPSLASDGAHAMLMGVENRETGRLIPVTLHFAQAGAITTRARVGEPGDPHAGHGMGGGQADAAAGVVPSLSLEVMPDGPGWRVRAEVSDFTFVPTDEEPVDVPGEGHGHLYLNGLKLQRLYQPDARIGALPPGTYTVSVVLNSNTHRPYLRNGAPVSARVAVTQD